MNSWVYIVYHKVHAVIIVLDVQMGPFWELFKSFAAPLIFGSATGYLVHSWFNPGTMHFTKESWFFLLGNSIERPQEGSGWRIDILIISLLKKNASPRKVTVNTYKNLIHQQHQWVEPWLVTYCLSWCYLVPYLYGDWFLFVYIILYEW